MNSIEFPYCTISYKKPVITIVLREGVELDAKEMREIIYAAHELSHEKPFVVLTDARVNVGATSEARRIAATKKEAPFIIANALVTNNLAVKLTANFFVKFNKPHFKFRVFGHESKAIEWLKQFEPMLEKKMKETV